MSAASAKPGESFALETVEISKHFGAVRAVDELTISIPRTGVTSIVGPNGSGKSTLVNLLSGTLPLDGGLVIIDGVSLKVVKAHETARPRPHPEPFRRCGSSIRSACGTTSW